MPASNCRIAVLFLFRPDCISIMLLGITKSFQLCLLRSLSALAVGMIVASEADVVIPDVEAVRNTETGADAEPSRISRAWSKLSSASALLLSASSACSRSSSRFAAPTRRPDFDGDPTTGSRNVLGDPSLLEVGVPPNMKPPESLRPCFFEIDPIRRMVLAVDMAKLAVRGDAVDGVGGVSEDAERLPMTSANLDPWGPWSLNPLHPSAFQPLLIPILGAGKAETGRIFFRRGVCCCSPSGSVSVSLSLVAGMASGKEAECGILADAVVEPSVG